MNKFTTGSYRMLDEAIQKLKSTMITMVVLLAFLFITVFKHHQDTEALHMAEASALVHLLSQAPPDYVGIPADSDEVNVNVSELEPDITLIPALASYNYALPIYFAYEYCSRSGVSRPVFSWNSWEVHVNADECPEGDDKIKAYERFRELRYSERNSIDVEGFSELEDRLRKPYGLNDLIIDDLDPVRLPYDRWILECVDLLRSDDQEDLREVDPCQFQWNEISNATSEFKSRYNDGVTSIRLKPLKWHVRLHPGFQ